MLFFGREHVHEVGGENLAEALESAYVGLAILAALGHEGNLVEVEVDLAELRLSQLLLLANVAVLG